MHAARTCDAALAPVHPLLKVHLRHLTSWAELSSFEKITKMPRAQGAFLFFPPHVFPKTRAQEKKNKKNLLCCTAHKPNNTLLDFP